jgi:hypothetical protein
MKKIASLLAASVCLLALLPSATAAAGLSGWTNYDWPSPGAKPSPDVSIVAVPVDPTAANVPGIFAKAWPKYQEAIQAVRSAIAHSPDLKATLDAKGVAADKVIGITHAPDGRIAVLVSQA